MTTQADHLRMAETLDAMEPGTWKPNIGTAKLHNRRVLVARRKDGTYALRFKRLDTDGTGARVRDNIKKVAVDLTAEAMQAVVDLYLGLVLKDDLR